MIINRQTMQAEEVVKEGESFIKKEKKKEVNLIYLVVTAAKIYYLILKDQYLAML